MTAPDKSQPQGGDVAALADLLRETAERHDTFEKTHSEHQWSDWYAPYLNARQNGSGPDEAPAAPTGTWKNSLFLCDDLVIRRI